MVFCVKDPAPRSRVLVRASSALTLDDETLLGLRQKLVIRPSFRRIRPDTPRRSGFDKASSAPVSTAEPSGENGVTSAV
jgi:hypothetical protein